MDLLDKMMDLKMINSLHFMHSRESTIFLMWSKPTTKVIKHDISN